MKLKAPRYCQGFVDRHGHSRWYFRRPGYERITLPGLPWSPEFMDAYQSAMEGESAAKKPIGARNTVPGSISAVAVAYYNSPEFRGLRATTQTTYRGIIERIRLEHGDKPVAKLEREHIRLMMAKKAETPAAANNLLRMLKLLMRQAIDDGIRKDDPTAHVRKAKVKSGGFDTWSEDHIAQFLGHHQSGTRAHLALALLVNTGQRRSDVVRMGRQHCRDGKLVIQQQKTGVTVSIPIHPALSRAIALTEGTDLTFLLTQQGKPFSPAGFTNWFRQCVKDAGLPNGLAPHGLRKAVCRRLAEAGCSPHEIMSISGHQTLKEVERYTAAANRVSLAERAMEAIGGDAPRTKTRTKTVNPAEAG